MGRLEEEAGADLHGVDWEAEVIGDAPARAIAHVAATHDGWITAGGLIPWLGQEPALYPASSALSETVVWIAPRAPAAAALRALADAATTHLVLSPRADAPANGVVSDTDLVRFASGV